MAEKEKKEEEDLEARNQTPEELLYNPERSENPSIKADVIYIASLSFKLIHEKSDPVRAAIDFAVAADESISDNILATQLNGMDKKARRMVNMANDPIKYPPGLPKMEIGTFADEWFTGHIGEFPDHTAYPVVNIRENQVFIGEDPAGNPLKNEKYLYTRRILKKIGFKLKDLVEGLKGTDEAPNEDIDNLDDTFFLFASDIYSPLESTAQYLFNFLDWLEPLAVLKEVPEEPEVPGGQIARNYIRWVEYEGTENTFDCILFFEVIRRHNESGQLKDEEGHEQAYIKYLDVGGDTDPSNPEETIPASMIIKRQVSPNVIEVLSMLVPSHEVIIDAKGETKIVGRSISEEFIGLDPDSDDPEEAQKAGTGGFYIPMIMEIVELSTNKHEQIALYDGATLAMFAAEQVQLKWYQTFLFRVIMTVISIAIMIIPYIGQAAYVVIQQIMLAIFQMIVLSFIYQLIIKIAGPKLAAIIGAAFVIYMAGRGMAGGVTGMPFATELVKAVAAITKAINTIDMVDLQKEIEEFNKSYEERQDEINDAASLLGNGSLDPLLLTAAYANGFDYSESPDDFYERTIHTANPGVLSLDAVDEYVGSQLVLPEFVPDTLESGDGKTPLNEQAEKFN